LMETNVKNIKSVEQTSKQLNFILGHVTVIFKVRIC